eukprot:NODE_202_length_13094_cov_1.571528.p3 type:complete len:450 gc:universal NODE_202_length_13094_cov_1.571528:764-2113(+)
MNHGDFEDFDDFDNDHYDDRYEDISHKLDNKVKRFEQKLTSQLTKNMSEHVKTIEQCLDGRTVAILYKWINNDILQAIYGCIKTGKEGNVYYGKIGQNCVDQMKSGNIVGLSCSNVESVEAKSGSIAALKIYKTSCMTFKSRTRYMDGERRFRTFCKSNSRKLATAWGEKEIRNLNRLFNSGIICPRPIGVKLHIILMEFIGNVNNEDDVEAAPRIGDVKGDTEFWSEIYIEILLILYRIYHDAQLIHADFSEYNILFHNEKLWVIDVAQAVERNHPHALEFLKADISNVERFCKSKNVKVFSRSFVLDWVLGKVEINDLDNDRMRTCEKVLHKTGMQISSDILEKLCSSPTIDQENDMHFNSHVPNSLWEFDGMEKVNDTCMEELVVEIESENMSDAESTNNLNEAREYLEKEPRGHRHENRDDKKARKKLVKEENKKKRIIKKQKKK